MRVNSDSTDNKYYIHVKYNVFTRSGISIMLLDCIKMKYLYSGLLSILTPCLGIKTDVHSGLSLVSVGTQSSADNVLAYPVALMKQDKTVITSNDSDQHQNSSDKHTSVEDEHTIPSSDNEEIQIPQQDKETLQHAVKSMTDEVNELISLTDQFHHVAAMYHQKDAELKKEFTEASEEYTTAKQSLNQNFAFIQGIQQRYHAKQQFLKSQVHSWQQLNLELAAPLERNQNFWNLGGFCEGPRKRFFLVDAHKF